ncbi:MAG: lytic murein transglycosylase, partial [Rhodospirillaceae bacterium]|nr:lytic murein transglycosylase [Rhodospirillaceae bacterium]
KAAVTDRRVRDGRALLARHASLFDALERRYGVPRRFLVAFWGLETNYGTQLGSYRVVAALSTLAYDGRRSQFFRQELFDVLSLLDRGHATPSSMIGSWAGAMGQTQFMPSTFIKHAVDESGDGRIDLWGSVPDALGSAANYLRALGWDGARTWGREVKLPDGFDAGLASVDTAAADIVKPLAAWHALGVRAANGGTLPSVTVDAALVLPAGIEGPAFLVYENYRTILKWNRATFYALAVGHLADRLAGAGPLVAAMPPGEPLSRNEVTRLQTALAKLGHLSGEADGVLGAASRAAVRAFQMAQGLPPDGYASRTLILVAETQAAGG